MGCITVVVIKMIFWALCKVIMDFALHTLHNQHRSISDHIYNVDNTHDNKYIYHSMRYLFGIYKELIKCGLQSNSDKIVLYRSIYGISSELDITRIYMNTVK